MKAKKVLAAVLALVLAMGLSATAFAAESTKEDVPGSETIIVTGSYEGTGTLTEDVYKRQV